MKNNILYENRGFTILKFQINLNKPFQLENAQKFTKYLKEQL